MNTTQELSKASKQLEQRVKEHEATKKVDTTLWNRTASMCHDESNSPTNTAQKLTEELKKLEQRAKEHDARHQVGHQTVR